MSDVNVFGADTRSNILSREVALYVYIFSRHFYRYSTFKLNVTWIFRKLVYLLSSFISNQNS